MTRKAPLSSSFAQSSAVIAMAGSVTDMDDFSKPQSHDQRNSTDSKFRVFNALGIEAYLQDTLDCLYNHKDGSAELSSFSLKLNEKHCKSMIRALLGIPKIEYKQELRDLQLERQWHRVDEFVRQDLVPLLDDAKSDDENESFRTTLESDAPRFATGILQYLNPSGPDSLPFTSSSPIKFLSSLASGRAYQGKMERLLEDIQPQLVSKYQNVVQELSEDELLSIYVQSKQQELNAHGQDETNKVQLLQHCLGLKLVPTPKLSADGGKAKGKQGEASLQTYLSIKHDDVSSIRNDETSNDDPKKRTKKILLSPVWVRAISTKNDRAANKSKKCPYVLQLPPECFESGMTNEFDAMVVSLCSSNVNDAKDNSERVLTIEEIWEAKATLDPPAIHDVLAKKVPTLQKLLAPDMLPRVQLVLSENEGSSNSPQIFGVKVPTADDGDNNVSLPKIGLFGSRLPTPSAAAKRLQVVTCETLLETDVERVKEVLEDGNGTISPPIEHMEKQLEHLIALIRQWQPTLVVPADRQQRPNE